MGIEVKINKAFKEACKTKARHRVLYGGAGSGKSHFVAQEFLLKMLENKEHNILVVRKTQKSIRHSVFQLFTDLINEMDLRSLFKINKSELAIYCKNGSRIITSGLDDVEKLKSIAGINRIWVEEASEITLEDFNQLNLRLRGMSMIGYQMTVTFNPISDTHWLKKRFFDVGLQDSFILKTTYKDNKFLDDQYKKELEDLKERDYQYYKIYCLGEWGSIGNLIFSNWEKQDLTEMIPKFDNIYNGNDFGFASDPNAFIQVHYDKTRRIIYIFNEHVQTEMHTNELANYLKPIIGGNILTCDSSEPRTISELRRYNINAYGAKKGAGSIESGIKWLQQHEIIIHSSCINAIREISGYRYKEDKNGNVIPKPIDVDNHLIDALRYALESEMTEKSLKLLHKTALGL